MTAAAGLAILATLFAATEATASHIFCPGQVNAIFCEDFEGYPTTSSTFPGIPQVANGAANTWYGGRFEPWNGGTIHQDVVVRYLPTTFPDQQHYARFEDEAGILLNISTLGLTDVTLQFDWLTHLVGVTDLLRVGYFVGTIDFVTDTPDGSPYEDLVHRFVTDGPAWGSWTELAALHGPSAWATEALNLSSAVDNQSSVWIAFWMDDGEGDFGKIDNVLITAIPEPSTALLVGLGLLGLARRRADRRA